MSDTRSAVMKDEGVGSSNSTLNNENNEEQTNNEAFIIYLDDKMKEGITHFLFLKKNGEVREAFGTKDFNIIPKAAHPVEKGKSIEYSMKSSVVTFFDMEKQAWRSMNKDSLIKIL